MSCDKEPLSDKAERRQRLAQLKQLARLIEVPDCDCEPEIIHRPGCPHAEEKDNRLCDCPYAIAGGPCVHVRQCDHGLTLEEWSVLLQSAFQDEKDPDKRYDEKPPAPPLAVEEKPVTHEDRVTVYELRHLHQQHLYRGDDTPPERAGRRVRRTKDSEGKIVKVEEIVAEGEKPLAPVEPLIPEKKGVA